AVTTFSGVGTIASAGDLNGDGVGDIMTNTFVVFGQSGGWSATPNLGTLDGTDGLRLDGLSDHATATFSIGDTDINGDGIDDLVVGDYQADKVHVVFGTTTGFDPTLDLATLDGTDGFSLTGAPGDHAGISVSGAGDVNGDGIEDLIIGARFAEDTGAAYLVFGSDTGFDAEIDLGALDGTDGFVFVGESAVDLVGDSVAGPGDIDGDGYDDLVIGAPTVDIDGIMNVGKTYVVFGGPNLALFDADDGSLDGRIELGGLGASDLLL
ncbi:unnamed protein product, partial [Ectocarpus sp. 12 AP-2014]